MACGGQSYRQCWSDVVKAHGHKGLYNGFVSGLVCSSSEVPLSLRIIYPCTAACTPGGHAHTRGVLLTGPLKFAHHCKLAHVAP